jgi:hypothetical protein
MPPDRAQGRVWAAQGGGARIAPAHRAGKRSNARAPFLSLLLSIVVAVLLAAGTPHAAPLLADNSSTGDALPECPGIESGGTLCGAACQVAVCEALEKFYVATLNRTREWYVQDGWELLQTRHCVELLAAAPAGAAPVYCSWTGVACCTPDAMRAGACWSINSVANISITVNFVNGSISNPSFLRAVGALSVCGLVQLDLEGNELSGVLEPRWGQLRNLTVLNLGEW